MEEKKNFFASIIKKIYDTKEKERKDENVKQVKNIFLKRIANDIKNAIEKIKAENYDDTIETLKRQIKHHADLLGSLKLLKLSKMIDWLYEEKDEKYVVKINCEDNITNIFRKIYDLTKGINSEEYEEYLFEKNKFVDKINEISEQKRKNINKEKTEIKNTIIEKIQQANKSFKENVNLSELEEIEKELNNKIIQSILKLKKYCDDDTLKSIETISKSKLFTNLNENLITFFGGEKMVDLSDFIAAKDNFCMRASSYYNKLKKVHGVEDKILSFIENKDKQTIENATAIYENLLKIIKDKEKQIEYKKDDKLSFFVNLKNLTEFLFKISKKRQYHFEFLVDTYVKIVEELESKNDRKEIDDLTNKLKECKLNENDINLTQSLMNSLLTNCKKYIEKAKKHFNIIEEVNLDIKEFSKAYDAQNIDNSTLRELLTSQFSNWLNIFNDDIRFNSIEDWKQHYKVNVEGVATPIINNIKEKNQNFKMDPDQFNLEKIFI